MGMYTELNLGVEFIENLPEDILSSLKYMTDNGVAVERKIDFPTDHPLFGTSRWEWMLHSGGSYYFDTKPTLVFEKDEITNTWFLTFVTNIKNYSSEWQKFLDYIQPYIKTQGYIGTYRYEEDEDPTILYAKDGKIIWKSVSDKAELVTHEV